MRKGITEIQPQSYTSINKYGKVCDDKGWSESFLNSIEKLANKDPREAIQAYAWLRERSRQGTNHTNIKKLCEFDNLIGITYFNLSSYKNATSYLKKSTCLNGNLTFMLGLSYFRAKEFKKAYKVFKRIQYSEKIPKVWEECLSSNCHISTKALCEYSEYCKYKNKAFEAKCQDMCEQRISKKQLNFKKQIKQKTSRNQANQANQAIKKTEASTNQPITTESNITILSPALAPNVSLEIRK